MAAESRFVIFAATGANVLIAVTKLAAAYVSGSSAMLAEGVHSFVDVGDGLLLLLGHSRAARPPDDNHPFGHGKELYFWTLIVAILFFALGAGVSLYEGVQHILHPEPIGDPKWNYIVLAASSVFTLASFTVAFREFHRRAGVHGYWATFRGSKDPTVFTLVLEDMADLVGIALAFCGVFFGRLLHNPYIDGIATIGIALVMAVVAILLIRESKGLLVGEGVTPEVRDAIHEAVVDDPDVVSVGRIVTMYFGPDSVLVAMDVEFRASLTTESIAAAIDRVETKIRAKRPEIAHIYVEVGSIKAAAGR